MNRPLKSSLDRCATADHFRPQCGRVTTPTQCSALEMLQSAPAAEQEAGSSTRRSPSTVASQRPVQPSHRTCGLCSREHPFAQEKNRGKKSYIHSYIYSIIMCLMQIMSCVFLQSVCDIFKGELHCEHTHDHTLRCAWFNKVKSTHCVVLLRSTAAP